jgi:hypothetical protein
LGTLEASAAGKGFVRCPCSLIALPLSTERRGVGVKTRERFHPLEDSAPECAILTLERLRFKEIFVALRFSRTNSALSHADLSIERAH